MESEKPNDDPPVLCDIHHSQMAMIQYRWSVFPGDNNISTYMHCMECSRHFSPLQGYVNITEANGIDGSTRKQNECPKQEHEFHGSMAISAVREDGTLMWQCLHRDCRRNFSIQKVRCTCNPDMFDVMHALDCPLFKKIDTGGEGECPMCHRRLIDSNYCKTCDRNVY